MVSCSTSFYLDEDGGGGGGGAVRFALGESVQSVFLHDLELGDHEVRLMV